MLMGSRTFSIVSALIIGLSSSQMTACSWGSGADNVHPTPTHSKHSSRTKQVPQFSGGYSNDGPGHMPNDHHMVDATPKWEPRTRAGNAPKYRVLGKTYYTLDTAAGYRRQGMASWYGRKFHGRKTANGEIYDMYAMTAAHKSLPIPSYVRVRNLNNNKQAIVRVNDRGPFVDDREIDLSYAAAVKLGVFRSGTAPVEVVGIEVLANGRVLGPNASHQPTADYSTNSYGQRPITAQPSVETNRPAVVHHSTNLQSAAAQVESAWWVQAGAFRSSSPAQSLSLRLKSMGYPNRVERITAGSDYPYKVRIGPFISKPDANWAQQSLQSKGLGDGFILRASNP